MAPCHPSPCLDHCDHAVYEWQWLFSCVWKKEKVLPMVWKNSSCLSLAFSCWVLPLIHLMPWPWILKNLEMTVSAQPIWRNNNRAFCSHTLTLRHACTECTSLSVLCKRIFWSTLHKFLFCTYKCIQKSKKWWFQYYCWMRYVATSQQFFPVPLLSIKWYQKVLVKAVAILHVQ